MRLDKNTEAVIVIASVFLMAFRTKNDPPSS